MTLQNFFQPANGWFLAVIVFFSCLPPLVELLSDDKRRSGFSLLWSCTSFYFYLLFHPGFSLLSAAVLFEQKILEELTLLKAILLGLSPYLLQKTRISYEGSDGVEFQNLNVLNRLVSALRDLVKDSLDAKLVNNWNRITNAANYETLHRYCQSICTQEEMKFIDALVEDIVKEAGGNPDAYRKKTPLIEQLVERGISPGQLRDNLKTFAKQHE